jgi:hypothetical protein
MEAKSKSDPSGTQIDEGFRAWYASCSCCLSEAHPEVKAALDVEADQTGERRYGLPEPLHRT